VYLLTEVRHSAAEPGYFASSAEPARYSNTFICVPADVPFRPERLTEKPVVQGPQTATVVGPAGENIHTDQYGRVRLLFHWDRRGKRNEEASCWVRVSQQAAGSHWGGIAIPHVGQEVVVSFLEGDPDRPIVTGRVHNGTNMPPLNLPRDKNKTVMRDHGDNKIIMHGQPGRQWLSAVSPRAVNLVAKRSAAKPLSADIVLNGVDFDGGQDETGYDDLNALWQELEGKSPQTTMAPALPDAANKAFSVDASGVDAAYQADINLFGEGRINSMSGGNTNTWVGGTANTWINSNLNQEVKGDTHTVAHGKVINVYKNPLWNEVEVMQTDLYPIHMEVTGAHVEATAVHVEDTGLHIECHDGIHFEHEAGAHMKIGDMTDFEIRNQKLSKVADKLEFAGVYTLGAGEKSDIVEGSYILNAGVLNMTGKVDINIVAPTVSVESSITLMFQAPTILVLGQVLKLG
jgi:hypothetical protein